MNITVRKAKKEDMYEVADVHKKCFPEYFSTKIGKTLLRKYYEEYLETFEELFVVACDEDENKIIGFANGCIVGRNIQNEYIKKNALRMSLRILILLICFDKTTWRRVMNKIKKPKPPEGRKSVKRGKGDLLSICLLDEYRGCGASVKLIKEFEEGLKKNNINEYVLTVFPYNKRARAFYEKCGFQIYYETVEDVKYIKKIEG